MNTLLLLVTSQKEERKGKEILLAATLSAEGHNIQNLVLAGDPPSVPENRLMAKTLSE